MSRIVGLITEYNPFHNGHQYHIEKAKEVTGADAAVVVMSGNFVQRGEPAIMPKHLRAQVALRSGADLIIELPVGYATATAEVFSYGAVSLLHQLGCVDALCFGSECGDIHALQKLAKILVEEPEEYKDFLQQYLKIGLSYPAARQKAIESCYPDESFSHLLEEPNNILGIEYLKALYTLDSKITPYTITRTDAGYHSLELNTEFSSASAIRNTIVDTDDFSLIKDYVPENCFQLLESNYKKRFPVIPNDFSLLLKYRLLNETAISLKAYEDVSESLANKIYNRRNEFVSYEQFCDLLKTKDLTYSRISRALLHILLGVKEGIYGKHMPGYVRVLGFRKESAAIMAHIKQHASIPMITKLGQMKSTDEIIIQMFETDIFAADLYESVVTDKFKSPFINEFEQSIVKN